MDEQLQNDLQDAHNEFFLQLSVDPTTGWVCDPYLKFASYPHVGSHYGKMRKLMIVGMDIGGDPMRGAIYSYARRRRALENTAVHNLNPHMSGTYIAAMHFLADQCGEWRRWLTDADRNFVPQALLSDTKRIPSRNPLSYIAFTNYYKFLLAHNGAKVQLHRRVEEQFLKEEARILNPNTIILQSVEFRGRKALLNDLSRNADVYVGYHPSVRGKKRRMGIYLESIVRWRSGST